MSNLEKWAQNKPYLLGILAPHLAAAAQDLHMAFSDVKKRKIGSLQFTLPHFPSWFSLYRAHRKNQDFLREMFPLLSPYGDMAVEFSDGINEIFRLKRQGQIPLADHKLTQDEIEEAKKTLLDFKAASFSDLMDEFSGEPVSPDLAATATDFFGRESLAASFFICVVVPCWLLYRDSPTRLYRKARLGNVDALEKLLRLDALLIHDPSIGKQIQALRFKNKFSTYQNLFEAVLKRPKNKVTRLKMKYAMAGFISAMSSMLTKPLLEPDIRALFDAVQKDATHDDLAIDEDLPLSAEAFTRAIHRDRTVWLQALNPDKKI